MLDLPPLPQPATRQIACPTQPMFVRLPNQQTTFVQLFLNTLRKLKNIV